MHSEDIEALENATLGERAVFRFLQEVARPDFVLFGNQQGLLALEVEDWLIDQIEEADSHHVKI
jgi:hypothetical protein